MMKPLDSQNDLARPYEITAYKRLLILVGVFLGGLVVVAGLSYLFTSLIDDLDRQSANERARLFIGEEIVRSIQAIEKNFYRMAATRGARAREQIDRQVQEEIALLENNLLVLRDGGTVRQTILLNIDGVDEMIREAVYKPSGENSQYILEIIEISPHLEQIRAYLPMLRQKLDEIEAHQASPVDVDEHAMEREVALFLKGTITPFFFRLNENANRLFYESNQALKKIETDLAAKRKQYQQTEFILIVMVIVLVSLVGLIVVRQTKESNHKLLLAWEAMREARDQAEKASRAKSDFVSRMSHELRTPLNAILGFAQLLDGEDITPTQRQHVSTINQAGNHLLELINLILDMAKIESGKLQLEHIAFDPLKLSDDAALITGKNALAKGLNFVTLTATDLPVQIKGDPTRLRQILINLLGNAIKFTQTGEVGLRVENRDEGRALAFEIWDTGIGMTPETLARLFQPFAQADESSTRRFGGTGLGLAISKDLVEAMGGRLYVESTLGKGSLFGFELPVEQVTDAAQRPVLLADKQAVLICADEQVRHQLTRQLYALGASTEVFADVATARARLLELSDIKQVPDWVFADQETDGVSKLCAALGHQPATKRIMIGDRNTALQPVQTSPHANATLNRPVTYSQVAEIVESVSRSPEQAVESTLAKPDNRPLQGHLLLVDDNRVNQKVASMILAKLGLTCDIANNGLEAVELCVKNRYPLVLMDMEMPEMDGIAATRAIRAHEQETGAERVVIIAMTANALNEDRVRCLEAGMDEHLTKPVSKDKLKSMMERWLLN